MCEECEEVDVLREVYLARRARMARTWQPRGPRRWSAEAAAAPPVPDNPAVDNNAGTKLIAAE